MANQGSPLHTRTHAGLREKNARPPQPSAQRTGKPREFARLLHSGSASEAMAACRCNSDAVPALLWSHVLDFAIVHYTVIVYDDAAEPKEEWQRLWGMCEDLLLCGIVQKIYPVTLRFKNRMLKVLFFETMFLFFGGEGVREWGPFGGRSGGEIGGRSGEI